MNEVKERFAVELLNLSHKRCDWCTVVCGNNEGKQIENSDRFLCKKCWKKNRYKSRKRLLQEINKRIERMNKGFK